MKNYITVKEVDEKIDFVNLAITCKSIDAKSRQDLTKISNDIGINMDNLTSNIQIHSDIVNVIDENNIATKVEGDALVTDLKKVPLLIFTADCVPIAIIDKKNKAIGLVHAGWRGTFEKIGQKTIDTMIKKYNTNPDDVVCIIGPSIGPCCYEVSKDLIEKFNTILTKSDEKFYTIEEGRYYLNLWGINEYILKCSGVKKDNIISLNLCTSCNADKFHSYRKHEKTSERIGMILELK